MKKDTFGLLIVSVGVGCLLITSALAQSPLKPASDLVGEIITDGGSVKVNGVPAQRGSSIFNGSEIQTSEAAAFVSLTSGGGVLSIAPGSRVKITREQSQIIAQVLKGSVTMRSLLPSTVVAPDRIITSEPDNLYKVSVSDSGTVVESLLKSVAVRTAQGAVQTIAAQTTRAIAGAVAPVDDSPRPGVDQPTQELTDRGRNCFIKIELCDVDVAPDPDPTGPTLTVTGVLSCGTPSGRMPVGGARVRLMIFTLDRNVLGPFQTTTGTGAPIPVGRFRFDVTNPSIAAGGSARVVSVNCGSCFNTIQSCAFP